MLAAELSPKNTATAKISRMCVLCVHYIKLHHMADAREEPKSILMYMSKLY